VKGEIEIGKNLSQALYGLVSSKFGNVLIGRNVSKMNDVDIYFVPRIKSFTYSTPIHGLPVLIPLMRSWKRNFSGDAGCCTVSIVKGKGRRHFIYQMVFETNYDMAHYAVNEAIDNLLKEFSRKLNEFY